MLLRPSEWNPSPAEREALSDAGTVYDRKGLTRAGRAFAKHVKREPLWGEPSEDASICNEQGQSHLDEIAFSEDTSWKLRCHRYYGNIIEGWRRDGRGARWQVGSEYYFMGFLDPQ